MGYGLDEKRENSHAAPIASRKFFLAHSVQTAQRTVNICKQTSKAGGR
jgi:hypothetical protein